MTREVIPGAFTADTKFPNDILLNNTVRVRMLPRIDQSHPTVRRCP